MGKSCKKTHKKVSGECVPNNVVNKRLYARIKKKISKIFTLDVNEAKPIAVPKKGALHGVAINVANIPEKK